MINALNVGSRQFQKGQTFAEQSVYSGSDIMVIAIYGPEYIHIGNAHTLSYSIHREKFPVRRLGRTYAAGYTRGSRTIAGSLVFVNFQAAALAELFKHFQYDSQDAALPAYSILTDQLPPFDLILLFMNEAGRMSVMKLIGVEIVDEGGVLGVNEAYPETTMQYLARDISLMQPVELRPDPETGDFYMEVPNDKMVLTLGSKLIRDFISKGRETERYWPYHENPSDKLTTK